MKDDPYWAEGRNPYQQGMDGERVWLNTNGERVVRKKKKKPPGEEVPFGSGVFDSDERRLLLGLLGTGGILQVVLNVFIKPTQPRRGRDSDADARYASALDGDAVTRPAIEEQLEDVVNGRIASDKSTVANLVSVLESQGGPSLMAASRRGKWAVPWVGGWQRLCTSETDASFFGGPSKMSVQGFEQVSCRHFIYGPGEGGIIIEYLYAPAGQSAELAPSTSKLLLTRSGTLDNLGDNEFEIDFREPLQVSPRRSRCTRPMGAADARGRWTRPMRAADARGRCARPMRAADARTHGACLVGMAPPLLGNARSP
jgi:hypothetical protein